MIVRELPDNHLLCINQTSHALMAQEFCRHWGNRDFARPEPYAPVMLAIAQHDNGWHEWELAPEIRDDGYPMDFMHGPVASIKLDLWRRGIGRAASQHPYAALLIARHAILLYQSSLPMLSASDQLPTRTFFSEQDFLLARTRHVLRHDRALAAALRDEILLANTRLLQFGDSVSLQACIPWPSPRTIRHCPVDFAGTYTQIEMRATHEGDGEGDDDTITFYPWPFGIDEFTVAIHGRLLDRRTFASHDDYRAALAAAPIRTLTWRVVRAV